MVQISISRPYRGKIAVEAEASKTEEGRALLAQLKDTSSAYSALRIREDELLQEDLPRDAVKEEIKQCDDVRQRIRGALYNCAETNWASSNGFRPLYGDVRLEPSLGTESAADTIATLHQVILQIEEAQRTYGEIRVSIYEEDC